MRVNMHEAKSNLSKLVSKARAGEVVEIGPAGGDAVRLIAVKKGGFPWGCMRVHGELDPHWDSQDTNKTIAKLFNEE